MLNSLKARFCSTAALVSVALAGILIAATEFFVANEIKNLDVKRTLDATAFGNMLQSRVDRELNTLLFISGGLRSYVKVYHRHLDDAKLNAILADLYASSRHVRNLGIAVGYRMAFVHPLKGNEKAVGLDFRTVPAQLPKVEQAIATGKGVLDGPLTLVQGGQALVYRYPIFVDGKYWGIVSTVIDTPSFFAGAFAEVAQQPYRFAIRRLDEAGRIGNVFHGDASLFEREGVTLVSSAVPNGRWQWAIASTENPGIHAIAASMRLLGWALSLLIGAMIYMLLQQRARLAQDALHDSLTGLANRRLLVDRLTHALRRLPRAPTQTCSVIFFDLNGFKAINDVYGHEAGDFVLQVVARRIAEQVRNCDTVARLGGDEFVVAMVHEQNDALPALLEQRLRKAILEPVAFNGNELKVRTSLGIATCPQDGISANELIKAADVRMYEEKRSPVAPETRLA